MTLHTTDEQLAFFGKFLKENSGYHLVSDKRYLLESRLKTVLELYKMSSYEEVINALKKDPRGQIAESVIEVMTINETFFFRDDTPFEVFKDKIIPRLIEEAKGRPIKIWSAACSTGQEPYSIAIVMEEYKKKTPSLSYEVYASDINNRILAKARQGDYTLLEVGRGLPEDYKNKYFTPDGTHWHINEDIRKKVVFRQHNLRDKFDGVGGPFDIVFLRNVLIYFEQDLKDQILDKTAKVMRPGGYLFLGAAENVYNPELGYKRDPDLKNVYINGQ